MENKDYKHRIIDEILEEYLKIFGAVCVEGPKWCGKTWTLSYHSKLGANQIDSASENLIKINEKIKEDPKSKPAKVLCVICGLSNAAYKRPDGVYIVPITALKN